MNCIIVDDEELARAALKKCVEQVDFLNLKAVCSSAMEANQEIEKGGIDLIFLDIEMPEMSGIEFLRHFNDIPQVIFVTSVKDYAVEAFEFNVTDYIVKPVEFSRFFKAASKAKQMHESLEVPNNDSKDIFIKQDSRLVRVNMEEIFLIEALADYVNIYTESGRYTILSTMKALESKLSNEAFARVHRSYIVRLNKIKEIEDKTILIEKKLIPISRSYKDNLMKKLKML